MPLTGNIGEWSEVYIFLKLLGDAKIHAADKDMNRIDNVYLNIIKIIREEFQNSIYDYYTGDVVKIYLNSIFTGIELPRAAFIEKKDRLLSLMSANSKTTFGDVEIEKFLSMIHITKLKAPAMKSSAFFGGTSDIVMTVIDYRSGGVERTVGFSCKSDFGNRATLFNASCDNTNFEYEITGPIDDEIMNKVNSMFIVRKGKRCVAVGDRTRKLKEVGCDLKYISPCKEKAKRNLVMAGGNELHRIVGEALKFYYWIGDNGIDYAPIKRATDYVTRENPANYEYVDIESIYRSKFSELLYKMFTGMRLGTSWDGRSSVNGGYVVMKGNGDVLAYHSCIEDEFKDFLFNRLGFETPSAGRHKFMSVYKNDGKYYLKLNLQIRFI